MNVCFKSLFSNQFLLPGSKFRHQMDIRQCEGRCYIFFRRSSNLIISTLQFLNPLRPLCICALCILLLRKGGYCSIVSKVRPENLQKNHSNDKGYQGITRNQTKQRSLKKNHQTTTINKQKIRAICHEMTQSYFMTNR